MRQKIGVNMYTIYVCSHLTPISVSFRHPHIRSRTEYRFSDIGWVEIESYLQVNNATSVRCFAIQFFRF